MMIVRVEPRGDKFIWFVSDVPYGIALARGVNGTEEAARAEAARRLAWLEIATKQEGRDE